MLEPGSWDRRHCPVCIDYRPGARLTSREFLIHTIIFNMRNAARTARQKTKLVATMKNIILKRTWLNSLQVYLTLALRFSSRSLWLMLRVFSVAWFRYSCNWEWSCKYNKMKLIIIKSRSWLVPSDLLTVFTTGTWQSFSMVTGWQVNTERTSNISQVRLQRGQVVNRNISSRHYLRLTYIYKLLIATPVNPTVLRQQPIVTYLNIW